MSQHRTGRAAERHSAAGHAPSQRHLVHGPQAGRLGWQCAVLHRLLRLARLCGLAAAQQDVHALQRRARGLARAVRQRRRRVCLHQRRGRRDAPAALDDAAAAPARARLAHLGGGQVLPRHQQRPRRAGRRTLPGGRGAASRGRPDLVVQRERAEPRAEAAAADVRPPPAALQGERVHGRRGARLRRCDGRLLGRHHGQGGAVLGRAVRRRSFCSNPGVVEQSLGLSVCSRVRARLSGTGPPTARTRRTRR